MKDASTVASSPGPFRELLGIEVVELGDGTAVGKLDFQTELCIAHDIEVVHGGAVGAFGDSIGAFAIGTLAGMPCPTIDLRIDYLVPATSDLTATAAVHRHGGTVGVVDIAIADEDDTEVAAVRGIYKTGQRSDGTKWSRN